MHQSFSDVDVCQSIALNEASIDFYKFTHTFACFMYLV